MKRRHIWPSVMKHRRLWLSPPTTTRKRRPGVGLHCYFKLKKLKQPILLLFETPSGFAIFSFSASLFDAPDAMEFIWTRFAHNWTSNYIVWQKEFQTFEDKSNAINENIGVNERLVEMIMKWHRPGMKMAVGKPEYKIIIEEKLGIPCLYDARVMELMWGIQRFMPSSVPEEKSHLTEEDRLPLSQGLQKFLSRYDCDVKPELVNDKIIETAEFLFSKCDSFEKDNLIDLRKAGDYIKNVSGISCEDWSLLKIATALKIICFPEEAGNSYEVISEQLVSKLVNDAPLYKEVFDTHSALGIYGDMMHAHRIRINKLKLLKSLIEEANEAYEAEQAEVA